MLKNSKIQVSRILTLIHTSAHKSIISISVTRKKGRKEARKRKFNSGVKEAIFVKLHPQALVF